MDQAIVDEMLVDISGVRWEDIAGLEYAKQTLQEAVILPNQRPEIFTGLRAPPKGVLLFGPPGTGKTLLAKAVASESGFSFFSVSASSLTSKWVGEGEKLVRSLFQIAREVQPAVIFIDEIDSVLSKRSENEHEASRRLKTEFMVQLDGAASSSDDRILVMGATNLPDELDDAVLRRLPKRVYVPLPDAAARRYLLGKLLPANGEVKCSFSDKDVASVVKSTEGYSCSDLTALCKEAAMGPVRELGSSIRDASADSMRPVKVGDFRDAMRRIRPSVSTESLAAFREWEQANG